MYRRVLVSLLLVVVFLSLGSGTAWWLIKTKPTPPQRTDTAPPLLVRAVRVEPQTVVEPLPGYGTASADRYSRVSAEINGVIIEMSEHLKPGNAVTTGEVLIRLDDNEYQARLARARAQLESDSAALANVQIEESNVSELVRIATVELDVALRELGRVQHLYDQGLAGNRELDSAKVVVESKRRVIQDLQKQTEYLPNTRRQRIAVKELREADVRIAELDVERCTIRAPFDGRLEEVRVEFGERITAGACLFSVLDPDLIEIPIQLPISWFARVAQGAACQLTTETGDDDTWRGKVARVAPSGNSLSRMFQVYIEVDNRVHAVPLRPGLFVRAAIEAPPLTDALLIPRGAIRDETVFTAVDGFARQQPITVTRNIHNLSVVSGIEPGTVVITSNLDALSDGTPVRLEFDDPSGGASPVGGDATAVAQP
ncbi:MAG: efflux RND transporter periplasmic adaptor subunit [Phycisphaerae bacterium]|nr:efflux RND transporter periplasmic adaptor subunit [Phycisphaerae bacterium]